ncbi:hypothetical protein [Flavobacterium seoulense]|uniref:hypothetical protein n=1 Tax=Flavobacterium seoulense TaxID=1492738 RepID=UPI0005581993|nr:hypothetical protein [Flavobacterium seoulense]
MKQSSFLKLVQERLPEDVIVRDETQFKFSEDECVVMLSWIQYFVDHYTVYKKEKLPSIINPYISVRLKLNFSLYRIPCDQDIDRGKYVIYIVKAKQHINEKIYSKIDLSKLKIK